MALEPQTIASRRDCFCAYACHLAPYTEKITRVHWNQTPGALAVIHPLLPKVLVQDLLLIWNDPCLQASRHRLASGTYTSCLQPIMLRWPCCKTCVQLQFES